jgi:acetylglutamate kinase
MRIRAPVHLLLSGGTGRETMKRPWVIKAGGELLATPVTRARILSALRKFAKGERLVFVHGGGPQIEAELKRNNVEARFEGGRRVTTPAAMVHVERILSGEINKGLAAELQNLKVAAVGLSCRDGATIVAEPIPGLGRAARPAKVNAGLIETLVKGGFTPVLSSVGSDAAGQAVNINADDAASALATRLKAERLVFLTNVAGVRDAAGQRIPVLRIGDIDRLIRDGVITGGMIPKVQSARNAILKGVGEVDIVNGLDGIVIAEGTRIVKR